MEKYADDQPWTCKYCYWGTKKGECTRDECYYLIKEKKKARYRDSSVSKSSRDKRSREEHISP